MSNEAYSLTHLSKLIHYGFATLCENIITKEKSLHAAVAYNKGDVFATFEALEKIPHPNKYTVQVSDDLHITLYPEFLQYINHSCNPNIFFDTAKMELSCLHDIAASDEFTFFYPSTEWAMAEPFKCFCGANNCFHEIQGASFLPQETLADYKFTDFIMQKLNNTFLQKV
ncbi:MAG: SET domain-containing protein-lysine N-methyltransferase [Bacteroidota bacterium]|nr:SET domain-containing protein-lysine N-methyltransferase [Bacteroidota bacterium]